MKEPYCYADCPTCQSFGKIYNACGSCAKCYYAESESFGGKGYAVINTIEWEIHEMLFSERSIYKNLGDTYMSFSNCSKCGKLSLLRAFPENLCSACLYIQVAKTCNVVSAIEWEVKEMLYPEMTAFYKHFVGYKE